MKLTRQQTTSVQGGVSCGKWFIRYFFLQLFDAITKIKCRILFSFDGCSLLRNTSFWRCNANTRTRLLCIIAWCLILCFHFIFTLCKAKLDLNFGLLLSFFLVHLRNQYIHRYTHFRAHLSEYLILLFDDLFSCQPFDVFEVLPRDWQALFKVFNGVIFLLNNLLELLKHILVSFNFEHHELFVFSDLSTIILVVLNVVLAYALDFIFEKHLIFFALLDCNRFLGL